MELPVFVQQFIVHLHELNRKTSTIEMYKHDLKHFFEWLETHKPGFDGEIWGDLKRSDYDLYFTHLNEKKQSEASLRRVATHLNGLLRFYKLSDQIGLLQGSNKKQRNLTDSDFITSEEAERLLISVVSKKGLTDNQLHIYEHIADRNLAMITLMLKYGLTIQELIQLNAEDFNFGQNTVTIVNDKNKRTLPLDPDDKKMIYQYLIGIPEVSRPKDYTDDPFFIAFHPLKMVFKYDYKASRPKRMSLIGAKNMIEKEVKRSGIRPGISATHFRNTCILQKIKEGWSNMQLIEYFGLSSRHSLYRYKRYDKN